MISFVLGHERHTSAEVDNTDRPRGKSFFGPVLIIISRIRSRRLHSSEQPDSGLPELTGSRHIHPGPVLGRSRTPKYRKDDHERPSPGHQSWTL